MIAVLAEDDSDYEFLSTIIRRLLKNTSISISGKGFSGKDELLKRGAAEVRALARSGKDKFIVCADADCSNPSDCHKKIIDRVFSQAGLSDDARKKCCALVPVQELEAWILADASSLATKSWAINDEKHPESIQNPKEYLQKKSRAANQRPRYIPKVHNPQIAKSLDLKKVYERCPSFVALDKFICKGEGNT